MLLHAETLRDLGLPPIVQVRPQRFHQKHVQHGKPALPAAVALSRPSLSKMTLAGAAVAATITNMCGSQLRARCSVPSGIVRGSMFDWHGPDGDRFRMNPFRPAIGSASLGSWQCTCFVHPGKKAKKGVTLCTKTCKDEGGGVPLLQNWAAKARQ